MTMRFAHSTNPSIVHTLQASEKSIATSLAHSLTLLLNLALEIDDRTTYDEHMDSPKQQPLRSRKAKGEARSKFAMLRIDPFIAGFMEENTPFP